MKLKFNTRLENIVIIALSFSLIALSYLYFQTHRYIVVNGVAITGNKSAYVVPFYFKATSGRGRIFLDIDTYKETSFQSSFLIAKEFISYYLKLPFNLYNYYIYLGNSGELVGGQSAGLTITLGFLGLLTNTHYNNLNNYVFTGAILPFGVIGKVAGIKEKFSATKEEHKILIHANPDLKGGKYFDNIFDVYYYLTGEQLTSKKQINPPRWYYRVWYNISKQLCGEAEKINKSANEFKEALKAIENKDYYAAASLCFVTDYKYFNKTLNATYVADLLGKLKENITKLKGKIITIYDAEAWNAARERYEMAKKTLDEALATNNTSDYQKKLSYVYWRIISAEGWLSIVGKTSGPRYSDVKCPLDFARDVSVTYAIYGATPFNITNTTEIDCYYKVKSYVSRVHYAVLAAFEADYRALEKVLPYLVDHFDLIGYTAYEYSKYVPDKDKLYYLTVAIDWMHNPNPISFWPS